jgi:hypothetical protein
MDPANPVSRAMEGMLADIDPKQGFGALLSPASGASTLMFGKRGGNGEPFQMAF